MALATTGMAKECLVLPSSISLSGQPLGGRASTCLSIPNQNQNQKQNYPAVFCGRGDKRTAKGKRFKHSFGNSRPRDAKKGRGLPVTPLPPRPPKKDPFDDDGERIEIEIDESLFGN